ncbi:hypothetical protein [Leptospira johnsonii]|nr:hypothetical protein [Leptospira johnsonii]
MVREKVNGSVLTNVSRNHYLVEDPMAFKLDGAKFPTLEELITALYPLYADKMSEAEFRKYVQENVKEE